MEEKATLLPCPFCGSKDIHIGRPDFDSGVIFVECEYCGIYCEPKDCYANAPKAIAAWNTRAERTCHITYREDYAPEQNDCQIIECSNGCFFYWPTCTPLFYCPKCGARVVNENKPVEVWQQASSDDVTCYGVEE